MRTLRSLNRVVTLALTCGFAMLAGGQTCGQSLTAQFGPGTTDATRVLAVEEDWELVVATPDSKVNAPQVTTVISPIGHADGIHAAFNLNHQTLPSYAAGGIQLQIWNGEWAVNSRRFPDHSVMDTGQETVRWTQRMNLEDEQLMFEILQGTSSSWGDFGGQGYLKMSVPTALTALNNYDSQVSIENSGVAYAGNRVTSLVLKRLRVTTADGQVHTFEKNLSKQIDE